MIVDKIKLLLGDAASNYTDAQIELYYDLSAAEVEEYCKRDLDKVLEYAAMEIAKIKLNRMNTEGLAAQSFSGVNESYIDGYPQEIQKILNRKRKIKVV